MSIMVIYGNNKNATILVDCRATCTMNDGSIQYYENMCKVRQFNKTIIGIIGDAKYANMIFECIKNNFKDRKELRNAKFEDLYGICLKTSEKLKNNFSDQGCMIAIAGITKDNKIFLDYYHTSDYVFHTFTAESKEYSSKVFCNYNNPEMDQKVYELVNRTEEKMITVELHELILEEVLPIDSSVNSSYTFETISLE